MTGSFIHMQLHKAATCLHSSSKLLSLCHLQHQPILWHGQTQVAHSAPDIKNGSSFSVLTVNLIKGFMLGTQAEPVKEGWCSEQTCSEGK